MDTPASSMKSNYDLVVVIAEAAQKSSRLSLIMTVISFHGWGRISILFLMVAAFPASVLLMNKLYYSSIYHGFFLRFIVSISIVVACSIYFDFLIYGKKGIFPEYKKIIMHYSRRYRFSRYLIFRQILMDANVGVAEIQRARDIIEADIELSRKLYGKIGTVESYFISIVVSFSTSALVVGIDKRVDIDFFELFEDVFLLLNIALLIYLFRNDIYNPEYKRSELIWFLDRYEKDLPSGLVEC